MPKIRIEIDDVDEFKKQVLRMFDWIKTDKDFIEMYDQTYYTLWLTTNGDYTYSASYGFYNVLTLQYDIKNGYVVYGRFFHDVEELFCKICDELGVSVTINRSSKR